MASAPALAGPAPLPTGGQVVQGGATIATPSSTSMVITQSTQAAVFNWSDFSIAGGNSVRFDQPNASAIAFNRVTGPFRSDINGTLTANGHVWISNPNGILFGKGAVVDVGGLVATTSGMSDANFISGKYLFDQPGNAGATVVNQGSIKAAPGSSVILSGERVSNEGIIQADLGAVVLGGAKTFALDLYGDRLVRFAVTAASDATDGPLVDNSGTISANGGRVLLTARAAKSIVDNVINTSGIIEAKTASLVNGEIVFDGGDIGVVQVAGTVDASGKNAGETGGSVKVLGEKIQLTAASRIDASGDSGGGTVLLGGAKGGAGPEANAQELRIDAGAVVTADALATGNGGTIIAWSETSTTVSGRLTANGGSIGGDGGFIETSSRDALTVTSTAVVTAGAPQGNAGTWLLDPVNTAIVGDVFQAGSPIPDAKGLVSASVLSASLFSTNQTVTAAGDLTVNAAISKVGGFFTTLTLNAGGNILVGATISTTTAGLSVNLNGGFAAGNTINVKAAITTKNGAFTASGAAFINSAAISTNLGSATINANDAVTVGAPISAANLSFATTSFTQLAGGSLAGNSSLRIRTDSISLNGGAGSITGANGFEVDPLSGFNRTFGFGTAAGDLVFSQTALNELSGFGGLLFGDVGRTQAINVAGAVVFPSSVTLLARAGASSITLAPNSSVSVAGSGSLQLDAGTGTVTQSAGATVSGVSLLSIQAGTLSLAGAAGSLSASNTLSIADNFNGHAIGVGTAGGNIQLTQTDLDRLSAPNLQLSAETVSFAGGVTLNSNTSVNCCQVNVVNLRDTITTTGKSLTFQTLVTMQAATTIDTAGGNLSFLNQISGTGAPAVTLNAGSGAITLSSINSGAPLGAFTAQGGQINVTSSLFFNGAASFNGPVVLSGSVFTSGNAVSFGSTTRLAGFSTIDTTNFGAAAAGANVSFAGAVDGTNANSQSLVVKAGTGGTVSFSGAVGASVRPNLISLTETDFEAANSPTILANSLTVNANIINFASAGSTNIGVGTLTLAPRDTGQSIGIAGGGTLALSLADISNIPSATSLIFGDSNTASITVGANATLPAASTVQLRTAANGTVALNGVLSLTAPAAGTSSLLVFTNNLTRAGGGGANGTGSLTFQTVSGAGSISIGTGAGSIALTDTALQSNFTGFTSQTFNSAAVNIAGGVTFNRDTTLLGTAALGDSIATSGGAVLTLAGTVFLQNAVTINAPTRLGSIAINAGSSGSSVDFQQAVTLFGSPTITTTGIVTFGSTVNGTTAFGQDLTIAAGTGGDISFTGAVGGTTPLRFVTINSARDVNVANFVASSFTQNAGSGTTTLNGVITVPSIFIASNGLTLGSSAAITASSFFEFEGGAGSTFTENAGARLSSNFIELIADNFTLGDANSINGTSTFSELLIDRATSGATLSVDNAVMAPFNNFAFLELGGNGNAGVINVASVTLFRATNTTQLAAQTAIHLTGTVATTGGGIATGSPVILDGDTTINTVGATSSGFINLIGNIDSAASSAHALTLFAGANSVQLGPVGSAVPLGSLDVHGGFLVLGGSITTVGAQTYAASTLIELFGGTLTTQGGGVAFNGPTRLFGNETIDVTANGGLNAAVAFGGTLDGSSAFNQNLTIISAGGDVTFGGAVGGAVPLRNVTLDGVAGSAARNVLIHDMAVGAFTEVDGNGTTTFAGNFSVQRNDFSSVVTNAGIVITGNITVKVGSDLRLTGSGGAPTPTQTPIDMAPGSSITLLDFASVTLQGDHLRLRGGGSSIKNGTGASETAVSLQPFTSGIDLNINGNVNAFLGNDRLTAIGAVDKLFIGGGGNVTLGGALTFNAPTSIQAGGATPTITLASDAAITETASLGSLSFQTGSGGSFIQQNGATLNAGLTNLKIAADTITLNGPVGSIQGAGRVELTGSTATTPILVSNTPAGAGTLTVTQAIIDRLQDFAALGIGDFETPSATVTINDTITTGITTGFAGSNVLLGNSANVTYNGDPGAFLGFFTGTGGTLTKNATAQVHAGAATLVLGADTYNLTSGSGVIDGSTVVLSGSIGQDGFGNTTTNSITVGGAGSTITQATLDNLTNFGLVQIGSAGFSVGDKFFPKTPLVDVTGAITLTKTAFFFGDQIRLEAGSSITSNSSIGFISFAGPVTIAGGTPTINTSSGGGDVTFFSTVDGTSFGTDSLTVNSGAGMIFFTDSIGAFVPLNTLTLTGADAVFTTNAVGGTFVLAANTVNANMPSFTLGKVALSDGISINASNALTINGTVSTGDAQLQARTVDITSGGALIGTGFDSVLTLSQANAGGTIGLGTFTGDDLTLPQSTLGRISGFGKVDIGDGTASRIDIAGSISLPVAHLVTNSGGSIVQAPSSSITGAPGGLVFLTDTLTLDGTVSSSGTVTLQSVGGTISVGTAAGGLHLDQSVFNAISAARLEIGSIDFDGPTSILVGTIQTPRSTLFISGNAGGSVTITGDVTSTAGAGFLGFSANSVNFNAGTTVNTGTGDLFLASGTTIGLNGTLAGTGAAIIGAPIIGGRPENGVGADIVVGTGGMVQNFDPAFASFSALRIGPSAADATRLGETAFRPGKITVNTVGLPVATEFTAAVGRKVLLSPGASIHSFLKPITFNSDVVLDTGAGGAVFITSGFSTGGAPITFNGSISGSTDGQQSLEIHTGNAALTVKGNVGSSAVRLGGFVFEGFSAVVNGQFNAQTLDLTRSIGSTVAIGGFARIDQILTPPAPVLPTDPVIPISITLAGGGLIDPSLGDGVSLTLAGGVGVTDGTNGIVVPTLSTSGTVATANAPITTDNLTLLADTVLDAGPGGLVTIAGQTGLGRPSFTGDFKLTIIDQFGTRSFDPNATAAGTNPVDGALGAIFSSNGGGVNVSAAALAGALAGGLVGAPGSVPGGTDIIGQGSPGGVEVTAGFETQMEGSATPTGGGGGPTGGGPTGGPQGGSGGPAGDSKPPKQQEAKPISPVAPLAGGLLGRVTPTVMKAPTGVPGIDFPYSSDGNQGLW